MLVSSTPQMGFNEFLTRCEILDFDLDGKMTSAGKMTIRDITRMKVRWVLSPPAARFEL